MKIIGFIFLFILSYNSYSQVGRAEQPIDTIPIGGEIQENKTNQMEAQDQLRAQLISLRDSVSNHLSGDANSTGARTDTEKLNGYKKDMDRVIAGLKKTERDESLMKEGYTILHETRAALKGSN